MVDKADRESYNSTDCANEQNFNEVFKTKRGAIADYYSSNGWLNDYCQSLPKDTFTDPAPEWTTKLVDGETIVSIILPIQSPLTEEITVSLTFRKFHSELMVSLSFVGQTDAKLEDS